MHGLVNRSIQSFLIDSYGPSVWAQVVRESKVGRDSFEPMLTYPAETTDAIVLAAAQVLGRPRQEVLEDLGTYLVSHPNLESVRRLLRFGGSSFVDFLHSLQDLPGRARLALAELELPELGLADAGQGHYRLLCAPLVEGTGFIMMGMLRAMADDYGALVLLDHQGMDGLSEIVAIHVLDQRYSEGRRFDLAPSAGRRG